MINEIIEMFSYSFMSRAFIVGLLISLCAALIGVSLVLRKNSMIGDGLSHVGFGTFAIATVLGIAPLEFAIPLVIIVSFFILKLKDNSKVHGDSAIALMSASALAIGTFVISVVKGVNTDINNYLFGSILAIDNKDLVISIILSIIVISLYIISYNKIFAITFDERFAKSIGIKTDLYNILFSILCSIVVVLGMRLMGALLISSLIVFPSISSTQLFKSFKKVVISSVIISIFAFSVGLITSYLYATPTGATIVLSDNIVTLVNLVILIVFYVISLLKRKIG